jgi:RTX calcium-binding nonapeptide repeat (4 copies)
MRLFAIAIALFLGAFSVGVAAAAPGDDTTVEASPFTLAPTTGGGSNAICPEGSYVTGGGVGFAGFTVGSDPVVVLRSNPSSGITAPTLTDGATTRIWLSSLHNTTTNQFIEPTTFALCSKNSDAVIEVETFNVPGGFSLAVGAGCPSGTRVIGGGVGQQPDTTFVELSGPLGDGLPANTDDGDVARSWFAYVHNTAAPTASVKVFALCSAGSDATTEVTDWTLSPGTSDARAATCPTGKRALGGGIVTTGPTPNDEPLTYYQLLMSHPVDETGNIQLTQDGDVARGWRSGIDNQSDGGPDPRTFKTIALCASDPSAGGGPGPGTRPGPGPGPAPGPGPGPGPGSQRPRCAGKRATLVGTAGRDRLTGTRRADVIVALGGNDLIRAGRGNDLVCAGTGNDRVEGGDGNDRLLGGSGGDRLVGGNGRDRMTGDSGRDRCLGGAGRDRAGCERKQ